MKSILFPAAVLLAWSCCLVAQDDSCGPIEPEERIRVTADFRQGNLFDLGVSATVIDAETLQQRNASHLEQVLNLAPNVNIASGASRGRFFQIRGIGERSQFVEPMNASVGLLVDGIDMTGIGGAATTLDIQQIEVLRGPQGTLFGANALAGIINMVSGSPTETWTGRFETRLAEYGTRAAQGMISGPLGNTLGMRVAYSNNQRDGFQHNAFLGSGDTANLDEQTLRTKLRWQPNDDLTVDLTGLYLDIDNGFDGFSLDNNRTTFSDEPGHDRQNTTAGSARLRWRAHKAFGVEALVSHTRANLEYGFDEDWSFVGFCDVFDCLASAYSSFDNYIRDNDNTTLDLRLVSSTDDDVPGWVVGAYSRDQSQSLRRIYTFLADDFQHDYRTDHRALYGQFSLPWGERWRLVAGLRHEWRAAEYVDSDGARFSPEEGMWGGKLALEYRLPGGGLWYALASRGYKAGGINSDSVVPSTQRTFATETLWNYELGAKARWWRGRVDARVALFFQDRDDVQTDQSLVLPIDGSSCPCRFIEFQTNATGGYSYGLEAEINGKLNSRLTAFASVGLMDSAFDNFLNFSHVNANAETGAPFDMDGRDLPHAPNYQFALGAIYALADRWSLRIELEAKDAFYFSSRHEVRSDAYGQVHAWLGYRRDQWSLALWARNVTDNDIERRGFGSFGNDPRAGYVVEPYFQFGAPRVFGATAAFEF